jgi:DNA-binding MarR family transcriptional regulator
MSSRSPPSPTDVAHRLHSATIHLLRAVRRTDAATGVSAPKLSALSVLVFGGPRTLGALAAAEQVRPPTMSRLVTELEAEGLVRRRVDREDRRRVRLEATPRGEHLLRQGRRLRVALLAAQLRVLPAEEIGILWRAGELLEWALNGRRAGHAPAPGRSPPPLRSR